jgi:hypothetical protein
MTIIDIINIYRHIFIWAMLGVFFMVAAVIIWGMRKNR